MITSEIQPVLRELVSGLNWRVGCPRSPAMVNESGQFKTRDEVEEGMRGYGMLDFTDWINQGYQLLEAWELCQINAPIHSLTETFSTKGGKTYRLEYEHAAELAEWCNDWTEVVARHQWGMGVLDLRWLEGDDEISFRVPRKEIETHNGDEKTYEAYVCFEGASYRCIIHYTAK